MKLSYKSDLFKYNSYYHYNYSEPYEICINDHLSQNDSNKNEESMDVLEESKKEYYKKKEQNSKSIDKNEIVKHRKTGLTINFSLGQAKKQLNKRISFSIIVYRINVAMKTFHNVIFG